MSFWPFGQNLQQHSNIHKILEEYLQILHNDNENNNDNNDVYDNPPLTISENSSSSLTELLNESIQINRSDSKMINDSNSSININNRTSSFLRSTPNSISDDFLSKRIALKKILDNSFIDRILEETDLLNELMRQNNSLIDFICLGYFYDYESEIIENDNDGEAERKTTNTSPSTLNEEQLEDKKYKKVYHLEYLIDLLMKSVDHIDICEIDGVTPNPDIPNTKVNNHRDEFPTSDNEANVTKNESINNTEVTLSFDSSSSSLNVTSDNPAFNKYFNTANLISDIFSLDIWMLTETLVKNQTYLSKIWSILNHKNCNSERSPLVLIFLKITQNLLATRQDQFLNFIRNLPNFVDNMLRHIEITSLMDFFLKCISTDKLEAPTGIIEFVHDQNLIKKCINYFDNDKYNPDTQICVYEFLKALISISANAPLDEMSIGPNSLTRELASAHVIKQCIDIVITQRGHALNNIVSIVIELIRKNNSDYDQINLLETTIQDNPPSTRDPIYLGYLLKHFASNFSKLFKIIEELTENNEKTFKNQMNEDYSPLGFECFRIAELMAELLHCSNMALMNSRKVENIAKKRDHFRDQLVNQLQDALEDLGIDDNESINKKRSSLDDINGVKETVDNDNVTNFDSESDYEVDESFEIPYINQNQDDKLRTKSTIGDLFKISLYDTRVLNKLLELFLLHPWNNFWHNVIFDIIQQIFNGRMDFSYNSFLVYSLFNLETSKRYGPDTSPQLSTKFSITEDFLLKGYKMSFDYFELHHMNLGYMGHLVLIAEEIVKFSKLYKVELISPDIFTILQKKEWQFYSKEILDNTRIMYSKILGGGNYVDDGNGNIIPQIPEFTQNSKDYNNEESENDSDSTFSDEGSTNSIHTAGGGLINVEALDDSMRNFTESDLHDKLRKLWNDNSLVVEI
ncbi:hypothetical protein TPHA_0E02510 [Tetrapisispora phaffii CBS 4417]|uniref:Uncharacterized protein n=1 Tax=Tetrapisispora phaffii (strain ATCC 24235 / CBS 4417 / NBRC 1672 / NRRL Y-8282 / UCD 70-5) TaxID=1071381 RepID=G8BTW5_TETPH|nr:hypothetical protein TPHA_0E02510 [Tetrapisispora phaffii CBS 4417]CCE63343.1 hypothetical protein TPHA_0E02510 [Tetrapisispora phaffii CBS 4417]